MGRAGACARKLDPPEKKPVNAPALVLNLRGGVRIALPPDLGQITPFVALEQEDWFEDEIRFVRAWLGPGMHALDVGANFGLYTLAMARAVGPGGSVHAFEPAPQTADFLARSVALNGLNGVRVHRAAISDRRGSAALRIHAQSELNALAPSAEAGTVEVPAQTLDQAAQEQGWAAPDFVKLDVEGHEEAAVRGGLGLFASASPLVMLEVSSGAGLAFDALRALQRIGYGAYRVLPGPLVLVPFDPSQPVDEYVLNVFACKPDRAQALAAGGWIAHAFAPAHGGADGLSAFERYQGTPRGTTGRLDWLALAYRQLAEAVRADATLPNLLSYARVAWELGLRSAAVRALKKAQGALDASPEATVGGDFLSPSDRYEALRSKTEPREWLTCAVLETYERLRSHSSIFSGDMPSAGVLRIRGLDAASPEIERRAQLGRLVRGLQHAPEPADKLRLASEENLNPGFWCGSRGAGTP